MYGFKPFLHHLNTVIIVTIYIYYKTYIVTGMCAYFEQ